MLYSLFHGRFFLIPLLAAACLLISACGDGQQQTASAAKGRITVKTDPEGAEIYVRGAKQSGQTPRDFNGLQVGTYVLRLEKDGYDPSWVRVEVKKNKTTEISEKLEPILTSVLIVSKPSGAMVSMDGKELGPTPYILPNLKMGTYEVTVSQANFKTMTQQITVPLERSMPDSPFCVNFDLLSDSGSLKVATDPEGAELYIDGEKTASNTPALIAQVAEGNHKIRLVKKGFAPVEDTVTIERDKETAPDVYKLNPLPGKLAVFVQPADCLVELNGERMNEPDKERELAPGAYTLKISKDGYDPEERKVTITSEEATAERITLSRNTGEVRFTLNPPGVLIALDGKIVGASQPSAENQGAASEFRIIGLSVGQHTLTFSHPRALKNMDKAFTIAQKGECVSLNQLKLWVPNANVEVLKTQRIYKNACVIPMAANSDEIIFQPSPGIQSTYKKSEVKITMLVDDSTDSKYNTSFVDMLAEFKEATDADDKGVQDATVIIKKLHAGSEVFINGVSKGKAEAGEDFTISVPPGKCDIRISHKNGVNKNNLGSNSVSYKTPFVLKPAEEKVLTAPPILWIAEYNLYLSDGTSVTKCRIAEDNPKSKTIRVELFPGTFADVERLKIVKKVPLKD